MLMQMDIILYSWVYLQIIAPVCHLKEQETSIAYLFIDAESWTALFRAFSSHRQPSASLNKGIPQLDKFLGRTGQTLMTCTVAEAL